MRLARGAADFAKPLPAAQAHGTLRFRFSLDINDCVNRAINFTRP
jgi:hypothetical protein